MDKKEIEQIPKVDLHLHLLGSFRRADLWKLCQKYNPEISFEEFEKIMSFKSFDEFSAAWKFKNSLIKTYEDFSFLIAGFVKSLKQQNIIYVEPAIALFELKPLDPIKLLDIAYNELKRSGIEFSFIMDLIRGDGYAELARQYEIYRSVADKYQIRGVGLAGNETKHGLSDELIPIFKQANKDGFGITIHASEHGNLDNLEKAITKFNANRIGHANYLNLADDKLIKLLKEHKTFLEFVPPSISSFHELGEQDIGTEIYTYLRADVLNGIYGDLELPENLIFNINSDDMGMYNQTLSEIIEKIDIRAHLKSLDLMIIADNTIDASFASEKIKKELKQVIGQFYQRQPE